jgi:hypothetical protein
MQVGRAVRTILLACMLLASSANAAVYVLVAGHYIQY